MCQAAQAENYFTQTACVCNTSGRHSCVSRGTARQRVSASDGGAPDEGRVVVVGDCSCRSASPAIQLAACAPTTREHACNLSGKGHARAEKRACRCVGVGRVAEPKRCEEH